MPIYEYRCGGCGLEKEFLQKVSDAPIVTCPDCGKDSMTKLISAAGFQLKGSGWYATDFKGSGSKPAAKPDAAGGDAAKSESGKSESGTSDSSASDSGTKAQACSTGCACH